MTDKEMAEEYTRLNARQYLHNDGSGFCTSEEEVKQAFLAGLKAGKPKWHDLRKNPEDLPETLHPVYAKLDSGTYVFAYCVNGIWHRNDDGIILYHGDGKSKVIAWYEIPKFEEV